jgi:hypothetical protein
MRPVHLVLVVAAQTLCACSAAPKGTPAIRIVEAKTPVAVSCVPKGLAGPPTYPDTAEALKEAPGAAERYQLLAAGRLLRDQRLAEVEPVISGCR